MARNLIFKKSGFSDSSGNLGCRMKRNALAEKGSVKVKAAGMIFVFAFTMAAATVFYLYQTNDLTNKGYEMKDIEKEIQQLKKENEKNKIKEVELRSMYNIEKTAKDLNLVSSSEISYLEIDQAVAMK